MSSHGKNRSIERVLIVNRGEIAIRVARTLKRLGITSYGVNSPEDQGARHTRELDHCDQILGSDGASPYLNVEAILEVARRHEVDAIHPGYGYLSENPDAARTFEEAGLIWIGPGPDAISLLGDKARSKDLAVRAGVPVVPGIPEGELTVEAVSEFAREAGYPILLKASGGGGGKGMRRIDSADQIEESIAAARRESVAAFGSERLLAERLVDPARHIEIQVAVDGDGNGVALGERECSLQRRYQKLIEESPSPVIDPSR
ncbi:MAG: acetyl/propionyl-CoA carboxylase subunit alpha, partial [Actinomycetota bacterium]|nr:acetyl/propionyl-CoA carboxylase subunit alpha [Actinomycetota bacterium]